MVSFAALGRRFELAWRPSGRALVLLVGCWLVGCWLAACGAPAPAPVEEAPAVRGNRPPSEFIAGSRPAYRDSEEAIAAAAAAAASRQEGENTAEQKPFRIVLLQTPEKGAYLNHVATVLRRQHYGKGTPLYNRRVVVATYTVRQPFEQGENLMFYRRGNLLVAVELVDRLPNAAGIQLLLMSPEMASRQGFDLVIVPREGALN